MNRVRNLQLKLDRLRRELGISLPGQVVFRADYGVADDRVVIVEADGFGAAVASIVEGNYPIDYVPIYQKLFRTERGAVTAAERVAFEGVSPATVLQPC
jgi:hypothetical protein